jgi:hypothetical protein
LSFLSLTDLLHDTLPIDDEHAPQTNALFLDHNAIVRSNTMTRITQQRDVDIPQPTILSGHVLPVPQRLFGIDTNENDVTVSVFELIVTVLKCEDFCRADETEGGGKEHDDQPRCFEIWCGRLFALLDVGAERDICEDVLVII